MKICFWTSYSDNNLNVFNLSLHNHEEYCKLHNYDLFNFKEPYTKYIDVQRIFNLFEKYDIVITIGTDVIIKRMQDPIENYINTYNNIIMSKEFNNFLQTLNGDFIIYPKSDNMYKILQLIEKNQHLCASGQDYLNVVNKKINIIAESPYLQIAAPIMNFAVNYSTADFNKFFSFHYHTLHDSPSPQLKYYFMKADLERITLNHCLI